MAVGPLMFKAMRRHRTVPRLGLLALLALATGALVAGLLLPLVGGVGLAARAESNYFVNQSTALCQPSLPQTSTILDSNGDVIAHFYDQNRVIVKLSQVPQMMQDALIAVEDVRFYEDNGIDLKGALRALLANGSSGSVTQGGSTLTQQYVKNVLLQCGDKGATADTLSRKVREAAIALNLSRTESKQEILQGYLNIVDFGDGAYGIGAAARHYFDEPVKDLTLPQSALLAGLVQAPSAYDPVIAPKTALARRNVVLGQLLKYNFITQARYNQAIHKPLGLHVHRLGNGCQSSAYPWFCAYVQAVLAKEIGAKELLRGGLTVHTTLDPSVEQAAEDALRNYVPPRNSAKVAGAEAIVQPGTGNILAIADSPHYGNDASQGQSAINLAVDEQYGGGRFGRFEAGSTFKLFVLAAALKQGIPLDTSINSPATLVNFPGYTDCAGDSLTYSPSISNAGGAGEAGNYNLITGTWFSVNTFYAQLEQRVGLCAVAKMAESLGVTQANGAPLQQIPAMVLGAQRYGLSALDMAGAYAAVAAHGKFCPPVAVTSITDGHGNPVALPQNVCTQVLEPSLADTITSVLEGVLTQPGATAAGVGDPGRPAAAKTGTSDNDATSDFAGFVPQMAAFVSVGHPESPRESLDGVSLGGRTYGAVFGATIAGPIWRDSFEHALQGMPVEPLPTALNPKYVHGPQTAVPDVSGLLPAAAEDKLRAAGFNPTVDPTRVPSLLPAGTVDSTSPAAGSQASTGTTVVLHISNGQPPKPTHSSSPPKQSPSAKPTPTKSSPAPPSSSPPSSSSPPVPPPAHAPPGHRKHHHHSNAADLDQIRR